MEHYYEKYGLKKFVFRLPTIYAYNAYPYMYNDKGEKVMRPLYVMINKAIKGEPLEIWGDPNYSKDMVHVYDFAQMLCKCILVDRMCGIYNVRHWSSCYFGAADQNNCGSIFTERQSIPISYAPNKNKWWRMSYEYR